MADFVLLEKVGQSYQQSIAVVRQVAARSLQRGQVCDHNCDCRASNDPVLSASASQNDVVKKLAPSQQMLVAVAQLETPDKLMLLI